MQLREFITELLRVSEKAAALARTVRGEKELFALLVEEKKGDDANKRFVKDFKTLADVLIQETVRHDIGAKFSGLRERIAGEESNHFTNTLGESIDISVQESQAATTELLGKVLDGNMKAATLLADVVHKDVSLAGDQNLTSLQRCEVDEDSLGIWIDPIDATAEYIEGKAGSVSLSGVHREGLRCVVVLIGVYDIQTGLPVAGVLNQPFVTLDPVTNRWTGRYVWCSFIDPHHPSVVSSSHPSPDGVPEHPSASRAIVVSSSESDSIQSKLSRAGFEPVHAAGAGYKILSVIDGLACAFVLTKSSCFKWDTCAPHAVLLAQGGGVVDFRKAFDTVKRHYEKVSRSELVSMLAECQLVYNKGTEGDEEKGVEKWSNEGGIVAYRSVDVLIDVLQHLQ